MFYAKVYNVGKEILVAICDKNLLGKTFEDERLRLEVSKEFYGGEVIDKNKASELLSIATIANLVGKNIVSLAIELKIVEKGNVIKVKNIPHAQMVVL